MMTDQNNLNMVSSRRDLLVGTAAVAFVTTLPKTADAAGSTEAGKEIGATNMIDARPVTLTINGKVTNLTAEPRTTLLDALREHLGMTGTKKSCDRGECGACTVHVEGRRVLSCMTLAVMQEGKRITTIEGLKRDGKLHPMQAAFIEHDGFQCGFCT